MRKDSISKKLLACYMVLTLVFGLWYPITSVKAITSGDSKLQEGLVAYWQLDNNYTEAINNMTTDLGAKLLTYTDGVYGKAAVFNGKDTYLYVNDDSLNLGNDREDNNDNLTISAWINLGDSKNAYKYLLDKGEDTEWEYNDGCFWTNPYAVYMDGSEPVAELSNAFSDSEAGIETEGYSHTGGKYVQANEWFLLTVTYDGKRVKVYHNNELLTQSNYTNGITFNNDALYIGVDGKLQYYFKGAVDDLRIYDRTLSYDEVDQLYNMGIASNKTLVDPDKGIVAFYPFDGDLSDVSSYLNKAEKVATSGSIKYVIGMNGMGITMSKGSYIRVPAADQLNLKNEFTISFWLKNDKPEGESPVLCRQNPAYSDDNDNETTYGLYLNSWQDATYTTINMYTNIYSPDNWCQETGPSLGTELSLEENNFKNTDWIHYTYTYKNGQLKCYILGELQNESEESDYFTIENASGDLLIGYDGNAFLSGTLDELKIFTSCLTADEVLDESKRVDTIKLDKADIDDLMKIGKGKSLILKNIILHDIDANKDVIVSADDKNLSYRTSSKKIFTVSKDGKITGAKAGKAKLTVTYGPHTVVYNVVVK